MDAAGHPAGWKEVTAMMIRDAVHPFAAVLRRPARGKDLIAWLRLVLRAAATRRRLARLDDRALKDIGISRADALAEAGRAPWDLGPPARHR
jgi:uncharacterized protein YjiS (DUF1127 family)